MVLHFLKSQISLLATIFLLTLVNIVFNKLSNERFLLLPEILSNGLKILISTIALVSYISLIGMFLILIVEYIFYRYAKFKS